MDTVVVYKANTESLPIVLGLLRKEGFDPTTLEDPAIVPYRGASNHVVRVAVPRDQAPGAASVLRKWDEARQTDIKEKTQALAGPLIFATMVTIGLALVFLLFGILLEAVALLFVIWLVVFALAANAERLTKKVRRNRNGKVRRGR
jgi:Flp pilus assembly protein TadB